MRSEGNVPQNGEPTFGFSFTVNIPAHRSVLVKDFLVKNNVTTLEHYLTWLQLIFTCSLE
jgi:hypothetical protein